jgi:hypothetical protein
MSLPFDRAEFFGVFREYNETVWPLQLVLLFLAFAALALAASNTPSAGRIVSAIVAVLWAWVGAVYHLAFFLPINPAAAFFGVVFLAGAALFAWEGVVKGRLAFCFPRNPRGALALGLAAYALALYPMLGLASGREASEVASFGLPCPTTIFTVGLLGLAKPPVPRALFIAPLLWSVIGMQAAWLLGVYEDFALLVAALAGVWFAFGSGPQRRLA